MADLFEDLTDGETWVLSTKLTAGAIASSRVLGHPAHEMTMEIHDVNADVQANWKRK